MNCISLRKKIHTIHYNPIPPRHPKPNFVSCQAQGAQGALNDSHQATQQSSAGWIVGPIGYTAILKIGPGLGDDHNLQEVLKQFTRIKWIFASTRRDRNTRRAQNLLICCQIGGRQVDVKRAVCRRQSCGQSNLEKKSEDASLIVSFQIHFITCL